MKYNPIAANVFIIMIDALRICCCIILSSRRGGRKCDKVVSCCVYLCACRVLHNPDVASSLLLPTRPQRPQWSTLKQPGCG